MADNPKSLASLAGELEHGLTPAEMERVCRYVASKGWQGNLPYMRATLAAIEDAGFAVVPREAAAALRAPTIAADERCESCRKVLGRGWKYDSTGDVKLCLACYTALATPSPTIAALEPLQLTESEAAELDAFRAKPSRAEGLTFTPSPTIAAPSPSQSNAIDLPPCPVCGETLVTRYSGPLPGCPQGISTAVCPTNPSHASQPPQASPSDEVTAEMVEAAKRILFHETEECDEEVRLAIAAALKARKPSPSQADEGSNDGGIL